MFAELAVKSQAWKDEWDAVLRAAEKELQTSVTFEEYKWACGIFMSRAFPARIVYQTPECEDLTMLLPVVDSLNHRPNTAVQWDGYGNEDSGTKAGFQLSLCQSVAAEEQVYNNYGPKNNEELLLGYGFTIQEAEPFDAVMLRLIVPVPFRSNPLFASQYEKEGANWNGSYIFRLARDETELDSKLVECFALFSAPPSPTGPTSFTLAQTLAGITSLQLALGSKLNALRSNQPSREPSEDAFRFENVMRYRSGQEAILLQSLTFCANLVESKISSARHTFDLRTVFDNKANRSYFRPIRKAVPHIFGASTSEELISVGAYEQVLCLVLVSERLKGETSQFHDFLSQVWPSAPAEVDERYTDLYESLFPAVVDIDETLFGVQGWSAEKLSEAGRVLDVYGCEFPSGHFTILLE